MEAPSADAITDDMASRFRLSRRQAKTSSACRSVAGLNTRRVLEPPASWGDQARDAVVAGTGDDLAGVPER